MKKNGEFVGIDDEFVPEDEKYVEDSALGSKKVRKGIGIGYIVTGIIVTIVVLVLVIGIFIWIFKIENNVFNSNLGIMDQFFNFVEKEDNKFDEDVKGIMDTYSERSEPIDNEYENKKKEIQDMHDKAKFNMGLENMQGTQNTFLLSKYLDKIVTSNKSNTNHIITVTYRETTSAAEDDIVGIKHSLVDESEYEVSVDYDENGYINKVTIKDI